MNNKYNLNITEEVKVHFENVLLNFTKVDENEIIGTINNVIHDIRNSNADEYVMKHLETLENLVQMVTDKKWKMSKTDKHFLFSALQYFIDEDDIIPDNTPVVGLLDDCIMIDIVEDKLKTKIQAYNTFKDAARIYALDETYSTKDWAETQRKEVFSRIRHRRTSTTKRNRSRGTSFSIM